MMAAAPLCVLILLTAGLSAGAISESGTVIPAESRPCVDCHAFEFMQRALQDLKRTANNLNTRDICKNLMQGESTNLYCMRRECRLPNGKWRCCHGECTD